MMHRLLTIYRFKVKLGDHELTIGSCSCHWQVCLFFPFSIFWELPANFHNGKNRSTKCWFYFRSAENFFPSSSGTILYLEISSLVDPLFPFSLPCYCSARNFPICFPFAQPLISRSAFHTTSTFKWTESLEPHTICIWLIILKESWIRWQKVRKRSIV